HAQQRAPSLPRAHRIHVALVRALVPRLATAAGACRVPDLRGAADPAAHHRRPDRLDGALRNGRLPDVLGAGRPRPGRARGHRRQDRVPADDGDADLHHLRGEDVHAVGSEPIPVGRVDGSRVAARAMAWRAIAFIDEPMGVIETARQGYAMTPRDAACPTGIGSQWLTPPGPRVPWSHKLSWCQNAGGAVTASSCGGPRERAP